MFPWACLRVFSTRFTWNIAVSFSCVPSCMPLKETFMKSLKDIKSYNNAHEFCGVLINAKRATETSEIFRNTFSLKLPRLTSWREDEYQSNIFIPQLKAIICEDKPEYFLVKKFVKVLYNTIDHSDKTSKFMSLLLDIDDYPFWKLEEDPHSREYLENIINKVESLINSYDERSLYSQYCKKYPPGGINLLQFVLYTSIILEADNLLNIIFDMGRAHLSFSKEEERNVGTLMIEAIIPISKRIQRVPSCRKPTIKRSLLKKRSSLQFLKDVYAKFPARHGTLLENFYMDEMNKNVQILDDLITEWHDFTVGKYQENVLPRYQEPSSIREENLSEDEHEWNDWEDDDDTDLEDGGASVMPNSHTWWSKCSQLLN